MSSQDRFAKLKEQIAKLKQQVPPVAEKIRTAKVALPKVLDPIQKAKEALGGAAAGSAAQDLASLQQDVDDISKSFPDINKTPTVQGIVPPCKNTPVPGLSEVSGAVDPRTTTCLTPPRPHRPRWRSTPLPIVLT